MIDQLMVLSFAEARQPEYREKKGEGGGYIEFGQKNDYPNYLVELFNKSAKHNAIIRGKVNYITGNGFKVVGESDAIAENYIKNANQFESLNEINRKVSTDIEIFGGAYLQVIWSQVGEKIAEIYHVDYTKIRSNEDNTQFWYSIKWSDNKFKKDYFNSFNPKWPTGSQILYLKEYRPNLNAYALPAYFGALNYIESDIEISKHVLGNAKTGFSASKLITLPNGEPTNDEKRATERKFTERFSGSDGKKFIINFVNDASRKAIVEDLGASDITKEDFQNVDKLIQQNIYAGHQITAPDLFGISTPGQLGSRQQMRDSYEIFKNTYINDKQIYLEGIFSMLGKLYGAKSALQIVPVEPIGIDFSEAVIKEIAPKAWLLEKLGIDITKYEKKITSPTNAQEPSQMRTNFSENDVLAMFETCGESKSDYTIFKTRQVFSLQVNEQEEAMNLDFAEQALTVLEANILDLIQKDKLITPEIIAKAIQTDLAIVKKVIEGLIKSNIITSKLENGVLVRNLTSPISKLDAPKPQTTTFQIRYAYDWNSSIPTNERNSAAHPSRPFCARLMQLDKLYTRAEIESISARLGYSVFDRRGGWWTQPNGQASPSCRHKWVSQTVIKKS